MNREMTPYRALMKSYEIYLQRNAKYSDVWKNYGALNNLVRGATKVDRLMEVWWHGDGTLHKDALDDAYDAINFLAFFIAQATNGELTAGGQGPYRPKETLVEESQNVVRLRSEDPYEQ